MFTFSIRPQLETQTAQCKGPQFGFTSNILIDIQLQYGMWLAMFWHGGASPLILQQISLELKQQERIIVICNIDFYQNLPEGLR